MRSPKKSKRNYYLEDIPLNSAITEFDEALKNYPSIVTKTEIISIANAINRVTAKPVFAKLSSPHYDSAAMDGVAVSSCNTNGATDTKPKFLQNNIDFAWVNTGDEVPKHFDSVIMIENIKEVENGIEIRDGRYGMYITDGKTNVKMPKGITSDALTLEEAQKLIDEKKANPKKRFRKKK